MDSKLKELQGRKHSLFTSTISGEVGGEVTLLGEKLTDVAKNKSFASIVGSLWLGRALKSQKTVDFIELVLNLLVDHGPYQSGAVTTMISARAGKDLVSSLVTGLLTIGPKFGGAVNAAAQIFYTGIELKKAPHNMVEEMARAKKYIPGIGHKKYRLDMMDPRVLLLKQSVRRLKKHAYLDYALEIEKITSAKKPNLILNIDGTMAAILLDLLANEERVPSIEIQKLIDAEFFNAFFILSRSVGFIGHYLDQKRIGEGLFRLEPEQVLSVNQSS